MNPRLQVMLDSREIEAAPAGDNEVRGMWGKAARSLHSSSAAESCWNSRAPPSRAPPDRSPSPTPRMNDMSDRIGPETRRARKVASVTATSTAPSDATSAVAMLRRAEPRKSDCGAIAPTTHTRSPCTRNAVTRAK